MLLVATLSDQIALSFLLKGDMYGVRGLNFGLAGLEMRRSGAVGQEQIETVGNGDQTRYRARLVGQAVLPHDRVDGRVDGDEAIPIVVIDEDEPVGEPLGQ